MTHTIGGSHGKHIILPIIWCGIAIVIIIGVLPSSPASPVKSDEEVVFFPTFGYRNKGGAIWTVNIHGWVFEPEKESIAREGTIGLFRTLFGLRDREDAPQIFGERARWFLVDNERGKKISVRLAGVEYPLEDSTPDGHFSGLLTLTRDEGDQMIEQSSAQSGRIAFTAVLSEKDGRQFNGSVQLIVETGLSIVSDIDDTIKVTLVNDRNALLENTFLKEFRAVSGMAGVYRSWAEQGAVFHYVSAGPWQLHEPLMQFFREQGFPDGSHHMRLFRIKDSHLFDLFSSSFDYKLQTIKNIIETFGDRTFFLVGDSGERDPEVYGALAREYRQVAKVFIREVAGNDPDPRRYQEAFRGVESSRWMTFHDAKDLPLIVKENNL